LGPPFRLSAAPEADFLAEQGAFGLLIPRGKSKVLFA
jgi:hypothetical protein